MDNPTMANDGKAGRVAEQVARVIVAIILAQTLFFKFTGAAESVYIFTSVGQEPSGRYGSGVVELIAGVMLFIPGFVAVGTGLVLSVMSGAIFFLSFTSIITPTCKRSG